MIERKASKDKVESRALYSACEVFRYGLERRWGAGPSLLYVMLNPSTATEERNDPTIERCQRRAAALGFGAMRIANLFAFRATRPEDLKRAADPVGPENDDLLRSWSAEAGQTLAAWGVHGGHRGRATEVAPMLQGDVRHLGLTKAGHPRHPLYVSYRQLPQPWSLEDRHVTA